MCYTGQCEWETWDFRCGSRCHKPKGVPCPDPCDEDESDDDAYDVMIDAQNGDLS